MTPRTLVIVPTYNERDNVESLVTQALAALPDSEVLVVDDASPDGTGALANALAARTERVHVLHRPRKEGLGPAYQAGFRWALDRRYDEVIEMDCDFSHDPSDLPRLVAASRSGADLVVGSRYVPGARIEGWPWYRHLLSAGANLYARALLGRSVRDWTSGFKCFRRAALIALLDSGPPANGYVFQVQGTHRVIGRGGRVTEVPIVFRERTRGASKVRYNSAVEAFVAVWKLRAGR
ncbi:MAG: polyprenol monophosphomannose synthase [Nitrospirota bacterium]